MPVSELFDALEALDGGAAPKLTKLFPDLDFTRGAVGGIAAGDGWHAPILRLLGRLDAAAGRAGCRIVLRQLREKFGLLRVYVDMDDADFARRKQCLALLDKAEAESQRRCLRCGDLGEMSRDGGYTVMLCPRHRQSRAVAATSPAPTLSAHARLRLAARFGAKEWRELQSPFGPFLLRARLIDDDLAFALSLRGDPSDPTRPHVVAAALARADGGVLELSEDALLDREADLAARVAAVVLG